MEWWVIILIVLGVVNLVLLWLVWSKKSTSGDDSDLLSQITLAFTQQQQQGISQLKDNLNTNQRQQTEEMSRFSEKTERRFGEVQLQLSTNLKEELGKIQMLQTQSMQETKTKADQQA